MRTKIAALASLIYIPLCSASSAEIRVGGIVSSYTEYAEHLTLSDGSGKMQLRSHIELTIWMPAKYFGERIRIKGGKRIPVENPLRQISGYVEFFVDEEYLSHLGKGDLAQVTKRHLYLRNVSNLDLKERPDTKELMKSKFEPSASVNGDKPLD